MSDTRPLLRPNQIPAADFDRALSAPYGTCKAMVAPAAELGYGEYRFNERVKDLLDPNGILSPGKRGIWPRALRGRSS